jgi:hypothetical protein
MDDGFSTTIAFADAATIELFEKEVTPPSVQGGGAIDTTTMLNTEYRTKAPKQLKTLGDSSLTVAWDPVIYDTIVGATGINNNQLITITFIDGATLAFWGWIDEFTPNALVEGDQPTAEVTIICSNQNDVGAETAPVYTAPV